MRHDIPDIALSGQTPLIFAAGFWIVLLTLVAILCAVMVMHYRTRRAGIYRKYFLAGDAQPKRHRAS